MSVREVFATLDYGPAPEAAQPAQEWLDRHGRKFGHFINGQFTPVSASTFASHNPSTGDVLAQVSQADEATVNEAVAAAKAALPGWQALGGHGRAKVLYAISRQIQKHSRLFAVLESMDNGKPIRETRDIDVPLVGQHFLYHAGWAQTLEESFPGYTSVGVCGQIIPWNFPLLMLCWKIAPALAAGNTVVLKPAEFTSLTALLFAEICQLAKVPAGVINIVTGDGATGKAIVEHPDIDKLAFTGSTEVGRILRASTAGSGKKLSLELGGKSPFIVFEDADLDSAVEGVVDAIFFNQGQVCCAGSRLLVQESVSAKFHAKLKERIATLRVGDPLDKAVDVGAIVDRSQLERIDGLVRQGVAEGAELFQDKSSCPTRGWFYPPTLLMNVEPSSTVAQVEIFGPVLVTMSFRTPAEAVALANNTVYGLASSVWSESINKAHDVASQIKAGVVWVNCTNQFDAAAGFGGYRESGFGREGGREGMLEYLKPVASRELQPSSWSGETSIDRTHKHFIGGKQARPDGGYSFEAEGGEYALGNRKDLRNAVEAAQGAAASFAKTTGRLRGQILYYLAENLDGIADEDGIEALFTYAAMADKFDGAVHQVPMKGLVYTRNEPLGVIAIVGPDAPSWRGLLEPLAAAFAMGNATVIVPSETNPRLAVELYRVLEASDIPSGVINIVTGRHAELSATLADHADVDAIWDFTASGGDTERRSVSNLKQTWTKPTWGHTGEFLRRATQVKNVWVPYGD
jgi:aldehyde dehydrogenase (NAD+)